MRDVLSAEAIWDVERLAVAHGACNVRVLGSIETDDISRIVFLVDMDEERSLFDLVALTEELKEALGVVVDVLTEGSISPYLCDAVLDEARPLSVASGSQNRRKLLWLAPNLPPTKLKVGS